MVGYRSSRLNQNKPFSGPVSTLLSEREPDTNLLQNVFRPLFWLIDICRISQPKLLPLLVFLVCKFFSCGKNANSVTWRIVDLLTSWAFERVARQWAWSASERKLDLFPLQRITSSDVILARTSQDAACSAACQTVKILFAPREIDQWFGNGMKEENTPTKTFIRAAVPENICLQCGKLVYNPLLRRKLFSGKQKTKTCQSLEMCTCFRETTNWELFAETARNATKRLQRKFFKLGLTFLDQKEV